MEESVKPKPFGRSKSFGQKGSIRRKGSFNKVRLQFENYCKIEESKNKSSVIKPLITTKNKSSIDKISGKTKYDLTNGSLQVINEKSDDKSHEKSDDKTVDPITSLCISSTDNTPKEIHFPIDNQSPEFSDQKSEKKFNKNLFNDSLSPMDRIRAQSLTDLCLVKSKIDFFEEKLYNKERKKSQSMIWESNEEKIKNEPNITNSYNNNYLTTNYGNTDREQILDVLNHFYDRDNDQKIMSELEDCYQIESNDMKNILTFNHLEEQQPIGREQYLYPNMTERQSSIISVGSTTDSIHSDIVSFDIEHDIVFRRPEVVSRRTEENQWKPKPTPRQRKSLNRELTIINNKINVQKEVMNQINETINDTNDELMIRKRTNSSPKADAKRSSSISQDSGISDVFQHNSSFLWQTTPKPIIVKRVCDETEDEIISNISENISQKQIRNTDRNTELIDDHIYEELSNFRSLSPNEWIDIENSDENKNKIQIEVIVNRRPLTLRSNNNYRKSFRPKPQTKRKSRKVSTIRLTTSDDSASATEYEDIDDEVDVDQLCAQSYKTGSTDNKFPQCLETIEKSQYGERMSSLSHIYESMADNEDFQHKTTEQNDIQSKLVRELSNRIMDKNKNVNTENGSHTSPDSSGSYTLRFDKNNHNIYTSTPQRMPKRFSSSLGAIHETNAELRNRFRDKRDSIMSRNSSIYISPNYCQTDYTLNKSHNNINNRGFDSPNIDSDSIPFTQIRAEIFHKQNSVTGSIASYLEFNTCANTSSTSSFFSEPLYQFYQKDVRRRAELWIHFDRNTTDLEYDDYENNSIYDTSGANTATSVSRTNSRVVSDGIGSLGTDKIKTMLFKRNISAMDFVGNGPNRSLWCQLPQVINSKDNLLESLSEREKRLQESMFEIITSEASYCKSLNILVTHFNNCIELSENNPQILTQREKKCLFSNIIDISNVTTRLLSELEKRFEQNILLYDVCDILYDYAVNHFQPYIHYCAYQRDQEKLLTQLTQSRTAFVDVLQRLESNQICQNQSLLSFLMIPMQRITRYPLLIDAVCQQLPEDSPIAESTRRALGVVNQLVRKCNEETKKVQRMQELIEIEKLLHFRSKIKSYPIVSGARYLVKRGSVLRLSPQLSARKTIGRSTLKWSKSSIHLFLFSDLLILAKKKSENNYSVFDYCSRNTVQLISLTTNGEGIGLLGNFRIAIPRNYENLAQLILLHNHESKTSEYTINFNLESEKLRWIEAVSQPSSENPNEVIYEEWDCPQVQAIRSYCAQQTDEIGLEETDVLNVCRKMKDGWFEGQRIRDGVKGWFPSDYTEEVLNQHVRARNIRLRHRLLMYTQSVIEEQKRASIDIQK